MAPSKPFEPKAGELLRHLLRRRRLELGLTRLDVASAARIAKGTLRRLETGQGVRPIPSTVASLAAALCVPEADIAAAQAESVVRRPRISFWDGRRRAPHGTMTALSRHHRIPEPPCAKCKRAAADYQLRLSRARGVKPRTSKLVAECGTYSGYMRHHRAGTEPCAACREACREHSREIRSRSAKPLPPGTSGYIGVTPDHRRNGNRWKAVVTVARPRDGSFMYWSKTFGDPISAARARDAKALEFQGDKARLNFPREKAA